jgi:hypothetical protein
VHSKDFKKYKLKILIIKRITLQKTFQGHAVEEGIMLDMIVLKKSEL